MNRDELISIEQQLAALLPTTSLAEDTMWFCATMYLRHATAQFDQAEQATVPSTAVMHDAWAERDAATALAYLRSIGIMRTAPAIVQLQRDAASRADLHRG